ncbi:MAG: hypothetical protein ABI821_00470 [Pseudomonadota bacterium]
MHDLQTISSAAHAQGFGESLPAGASLRLVRMLMTIDRQGVIRPTRFVESVQMRDYDAGSPTVSQSGAFEAREFILDRAHAPRLRSVLADDYDFQNPFFFSDGMDPIEATAANGRRSPAAFERRVLGACNSCHQGRGLYSVNSFQGFTRMGDPANVASTLERESTRAVGWKSLQPDWLALNQLWSDSR